VALFFRMNSMAGPDTSALQQQLKIVQGELNNNVIKLSTLENAKITLEQKVGRYEEQLRKSETSKVELYWPEIKHGNFGD
jgi:hypothetical protein